MALASGGRLAALLDRNRCTSHTQAAIVRWSLTTGRPRRAGLDPGLDVATLDGRELRDERSCEPVRFVPLYGTSGS
jgi:hypothetical protein